VSSQRGQAAGRLVLILVGIIAGLLLAQLGGRIIVGPGRPAQVPEVPPFQGDIDRAPRADVLAYARGLPYETSFGAGDDQRLLVRQDSIIRYGPNARIEAMKGAAGLTRDDLARGRIVARLLNRDQEPYAKLALGSRDTTYWWVDSVATGQWRSLYISSDSTIAPVRTTVRLEDASVHGDTRWGQSLARWIFDENDEETWVTCGQLYCCRTDQ